MAVTRKRKRGKEQDKEVQPDVVTEEPGNASNEANDDDPEPSVARKHAEEENDDYDDNHDKEEEKGKKQGRGRKSASRDPIGRGKEAKRTCPHCGKVIVTAYGLKYHIDNYVCRKAENPVKPKAKPKKVEPKKAEPKKTEPKKVEPKKVEPKKTEPKKVEPKKAEPKKIEPNKSEPNKAELKKAKPNKTEPNKTEPNKAEPNKAEPNKAEPNKAEPNKAEPKTEPKVKPSVTPLKRKLATGRSKGKEKRFRGTVKKRTCPTCEKVFTSTLGCSYHVKHGVCKERTMDGLANNSAFPMLEKGSKFITKFGIVEVIADDREKHTYTYPDDFKEDVKKYSAYRDKRLAHKKRVYLDFGFQSRLRRKRLRRMYEFDNICQDTTRNAYLRGVNVSMGSDVKHSPTETTNRQDPMFPPEAFPDRIVVCRLIPDNRQRLSSTNQETSQQDESKISSAPGFASTLYLRRRDLNKAYSPDVTLYLCPICGKHYLSREGFMYHLKSNVCKKKGLTLATQRDETNKLIQDRVDRHLKKNTTKTERFQTQRKREMAVYPSVWLSLGFPLPAKVRVPNVLKGDAIKIEMRVQEIDKTLNDLRVAIRKQTCRGAMYVSVFKVLGFRKPQKPKTERPSRAKVKPVVLEDEMDDEDEEGEEDEAEGEESLDVPFVDIQVLIDEVKSGRYPSIQPYDGDYPDECFICKDVGSLLLCDFCCNAVHLKCVRTKITIQNPEPEESFMCHVCARKIVCRRNRAEKRRVAKQEAVLEKARQKAADRATAEGQDGHKHESDYHAAAAVGKELSELLELLGDARNCLHQMTEASKLNQLRRLQLG